MPVTRCKAHARRPQRTQKCNTCIAGDCFIRQSTKCHASSTSRLHRPGRASHTPGGAVSSSLFLVGFGSLQELPLAVSGEVLSNTNSRRPCGRALDSCIRSTRIKTHAQYVSVFEAHSDTTYRARVIWLIVRAPTVVLGANGFEHRPHKVLDEVGDNTVLGRHCWPHDAVVPQEGRTGCNRMANYM